MVVALKPDPAELEVVESKLVYTPDQTGGKYHNALLLLHNTSDRTAEPFGTDVQLAIRNEDGRVLKTVEPLFPPTVPPGGYGVLKESGIKLPRPVEDGDVELRATKAIFGGRRSRGPVSVSNVEYKRKGGSLGGCTVTGDLTGEGEKPINPSLTFAGFVNDKLVTGGSEEDIVNSAKVFPGEKSTFEFELISPVECPPKLDEVKVYPGT